MAHKVGIPRALLYYKYFPMWAAFLKKLNTEVIISEHTNQRMVAQGAARVVSDTCLPVKVFIGHVLTLIDNCDSLLIPVVRSTKKKVYNCSRFLGLPDLTRAVVPEAPPILEIEFDYSRGKRYLHKQIYELGSNFTKSKSKIKEAAEYAWETHLKYNEMTIRQNLTRVEAIDVLFNNKFKEIRKEDNTKLTIGLAGHPYVLHDEQISHNLIKRLHSENVRILTPEMVPDVPSNGNGYKEVAGLAKNYWESEEDMIGAAEYYVGIKVDGIIGAMAFACGPDSLMMNLVQRQAHSANIPFMSLTVEEHTAEAGIITRLEAYLDMIRRSKKRQAPCV